MALEKAGVIDSEIRVAIQEAGTIRNHAVHAMDREPKQEEAQFVLDTAKRVAGIR